MCLASNLNWIPTEKSSFLVIRLEVNCEPKVIKIFRPDLLTNFLFFWFWFSHVTWLMLGSRFLSSLFQDFWKFNRLQTQAFRISFSFAKMLLSSNRDNYWPLDNKTKLSLICVSVFMKCLWPDSFHLKPGSSGHLNVTKLVFYFMRQII